MTTSRGVRDEGAALLSGAKFSRELKAAAPHLVVGWLSSEDLPALQVGNDPVLFVSRDLFRELDQFGTEQAILVLQVPILAPWNESSAETGCHILLPFQNPDNVGAAIRSAAGLGASSAILCGSAHPFHPKSLRAAGPTVVTLPIYRGSDLRSFTSVEMPIIALDAGGESLESFEFPARFILTCGVEGPGLPPSLRSTKRLSIAMERGVESLNAATALAIALFAWRAQKVRRAAS